MMFTPYALDTVGSTLHRRQMAGWGAGPPIAGLIYIRVALRHRSSEPHLLTGCASAQLFTLCAAESPRRTW